MGNAFKDILGFAGGAADAVLLGGAVGKNNRRNQFADLLGQGQYDQAQQLALRNGEGAYAALAQQRAAQASASNAQADAAADAFFGTAIDSIRLAPKEMRPAMLDTFKRLSEAKGLSEMIDPQELAIFEQSLGDDVALDGFARQYGGVDLKSAVDQRLKGQSQAEDARSNRVGEGLRSREIGIAQQNADTAEFKARAPKTGGTITLPDGTVIQTGPTPQDSALRRVESRGQRISLISDKFDEAIKQVSGKSAGLAGPTAIIPGSPARNLKATLDTIQANIGFEELNAMREASPTGGALGQVTEREIAFLQAVLGSLEQSQSPEQLKSNLERAKREVIGSWERVMSAYEQDFGQEYTGPGASVSGVPAGNDGDIDSLLRKYGIE